jgi:hypothetical protein
MKALMHKLVIGLVATTLTTCGGRVMLAAAPPHPHPPIPHVPSAYYGYHHHPGYYPGWTPPVVIYRQPTPIVVYSTPLASNPAPAASIRLLNPAENRVTLRYTLNGGAVQSLPAGYSADIDQESVIEFDRGGLSGRASFTLRDGTYKFVSAGGLWKLVRAVGTNESNPPVSDVAANPIPLQ